MSKSSKTTTPVGATKAETTATANPAIDTKTAVKAATESGAVGKANVGSDLRSGVASREEAGATSAAAPGATSGADSEAAPGALSAAAPRATSGADSDAAPGALSGVASGSGSGTTSGVEAEALSGIGSEAVSGADSDANTNTGAGTGASADATAEPADTDAESDTTVDTKAGAAGAKADTTVDAKAGATVDAKAEAEATLAAERIGKPVQMRDIARLAGVSKSTVSRALAGNPIINEKTRKLITSLARKHNYRLNRRARNFRLKDSLTIAVVLPGAPDADWRLTDPFFFELLRAVSVAVDEHGHQLLLTRIKPQQAEWIEEFINSGMADGLLLLGQGSMHRQISQIAKHYKAISVWGAQVEEHQNYPTVGTDNLAGGYRATKHLLDVGCRRILFLGPRIFPEPRQRYQGYLKAHEEAGIEADPALCAHVHHDEESAYMCMGQLLAKNLKFDGIFAVSDLFAMSAIRALGEAGIRVPGDICVVGYDDISLARVCFPSISSIRQNSIVGGKILVDNLLAVMEGSTPECVMMSPELVVRQSSTRSRRGDKAHGAHANDDGGADAN